MVKFVHEYYFVNTGRYDLGKIREECEKRKRGDAYRDPEASIIHHHSHGSPCEGREHNTYIPEE